MAHKKILHHAIVEFSIDDIDELDAIRRDMKIGLAEIERFLDEPMVYAPVPMLLPNHIYAAHF